MQPAAKQSRALLLDEISLPPTHGTPKALESLHVPPPPRLPSLTESFSDDDIEELTIAPDVRPNETRFSNAPPARRRRAGSIDIELSDIELAQRASPGPIIQSSMPPAPPSPKQLSKLPLFPLFAEAPKAVLSMLVQGAEVIELADKAVVMRKGDIADAVYGIVEGAVEVGVPGSHMRVTLAEGDVFGESALIGEKRHADVTVKGYLVALKIPRPLLNQLLAAHPPLAEVLLELLTRRLIGNLLQSSPLFQEFDMRGRQEIVKMFEVRRAPASTILAEQGKKMDALYISLTGEIDVGQRGQPIAQYRAGTMFGHGCMLTQGPSAISVRTRTNMLVLRLPSSAFHSLAMQYPAILAEVSDRVGNDVTQVLA
jgi:CRP-like cAMP-binding protein